MVIRVLQIWPSQYSGSEQWRRLLLWRRGSGKSLSQSDGGESLSQSLTQSREWLWVWMRQVRRAVKGDGLQAAASDSGCGDWRRRGSGHNSCHMASETGPCEWSSDGWPQRPWRVNGAAASCTCCASDLNWPDRYRRPKIKIHEVSLPCFHFEIRSWKAMHEFTFAIFANFWQELFCILAALANWVFSATCEIYNLLTMSTGTSQALTPTCFG